MYKKFLTIFSIVSILLLTLAPSADASYFESVDTRGTAPTYMASSGFFSPVSSPTDSWQIFGSSTKTIKIIEVDIAYATNGGGAITTPTLATLMIRSSANTSGSPTSETVVPMDSNDAAATAAVKYYSSSNPTTGTTLGTVKALALNPMPGSNGGPGNTDGFFRVYQCSYAGKGIYLRGTSQGLVLNFNGTTPYGTSPQIAVSVIWTEE